MVDKVEAPAITPWPQRVAALDKGKGVSNKMLQTAMQAEIADLRKALRDTVRKCDAKLARMRRSVERYEARSERMIHELENKVRALKAKA